MITFVRTADMNDGKAMAGFAWAVKAANYITENLGINVQVVRNVGGPVNQVHWIANYESLAEYEAAGKKIENDDGFQGLLAEGMEQGLFSSSSVVDGLYETIS